jgi:hypothetical protein
MHFCAYLGCNFAKFSKYLLEGKTFWSERMGRIKTRTF